MRSVVVVLPASMWAAIPMLRVRSRGYSRGMSSLLPPPRPAVRSAPDGRPCSPAVVGEGAVGFRHAVHLFLAPHGTARVVGGVDQLVGQALHHGPLVALARVLHNPAQRQGQ